MPLPAHSDDHRGLESLSEDWSETFRHLSDPTRLHLLLLIHYAGNESLTTGQLANLAGLKMVTASASLRQMANSGLLQPIRSGREVRYRLISERTHKLLHYLGGHHRPEQPEAH